MNRKSEAREATTHIQRGIMAGKLNGVIPAVTPGEKGKRCLLESSCYFGGIQIGVKGIKVFMSGSRQS
jgi:hypothetical protein